MILGILVWIGYFLLSYTLIRTILDDKLRTGDKLLRIVGLVLVMAMMYFLYRG